jgi:hypothetical protein
MRISHVFTPMLRTPFRHGPFFGFFFALVWIAPVAATGKGYAAPRPQTQQNQVRRGGF